RRRAAAARSHRSELREAAVDPPGRPSARTHGTRRRERVAPLLRLRARPGDRGRRLLRLDAGGESRAAPDRSRDHHALRPPAVLPGRRSVLRRCGGGGVTQAAHRFARGRRPAYWQSALAAAALVAIFGFVASEFSPTLGAAFVVVAAGTLASVMLARRRDLHELQRMLALILAGVLTVGLAASVALVIAQLVYSDVMA